MRTPLVLFFLIALSAWGGNWRLERPFHINEFSKLYPPVVSPDKLKVAYVFGEGRLSVTNLDNKETVSACPEKNICSAPAWSPDSQRLAFACDDEQRASLCLFEAGETRKLDLLVDPFVSPVFGLDNETVYASRPVKVAAPQSTGPKIYVSQQDRSSSGGASLVRMKIGTQETTELVKPELSPWIFTLNESGDALRFLTFPKRDQMDLYLLPIQGGVARKLRSNVPYVNDVRLREILQEKESNPAAEVAVFQDYLTPPRLLDSKRRVLAELPNPALNWKPGEVKKLKSGVLLLPAEKAKKPPVFVIGYPGDDLTRHAAEYAGGTPGATIPARYLTDNGFAVFLIKLTLSKEGKASNPLKEIAGSLVPQLDSPELKKYVDTNRMIYMGQSYGGYAAAGMAVLTKRFKAIVAISGLYDLASSYGELSEEGEPSMVSYMETGQGRMGAPPWKATQRYLANSPYYQVEKITTPLMLINGERGSAEAKKMYAALVRLDRKVQLAYYPKEGHSISHWSEPNQLDAVQRILDFAAKFTTP